MTFAWLSYIIITKKGVGTFVPEAGGQYEDQTGYLSGSADPAREEWIDQDRDGCSPVREVIPSVQPVP